MDLDVLEYLGEVEINMKDKIINWIKEYFSGNDTGVAIIGVSGGKDSTICAALLKEAIGADRIIAVMMPNGTQSDIDDSYAVCDYLQIPAENRFEVNIENAFKSIKSEIYAGCSQYTIWHKSTVDDNDNINTNLPSRLRMCTLYSIAALYEGARVCNTSNASERFIGYSTKWGDGVGDFAPLANLTVREVLAVGDALNLPTWMVHKIPSDGMSGKSDEEKLGFSYEELDAFLLENAGPGIEKEEKMLRLHRINKHKTEPIPMFYGGDEECDS